ncbi:MAG: 3-oxoacyl-[acyl-carrier-protein] synthase III C-terminal domain-containing protein [Myxococcota bacterium]|nr:3-oxoacyl-[acyl-carrier-protein] synthase III C-terminal domain-containing protein [Myxococcota bacterium]
MPYIHSVACALAPNYYDQETLTRTLLEDWSGSYVNTERILRFQQNVQVGGRHLAVPLERYRQLKSFGDYNDAWLEAAVPMATRAVEELLDGAGLSPEDVGSITSTTVTGLAVPSLDARLMNRLPFPRSTRRTPLFGLGCLAGVAGINRVGDYLVGHPEEAAILVAVELCSLTLQKQDISVANLIASGLFGDGGAAVLMVGDRHPLAAQSPLHWSHPRSAFFSETERVMGWDVVDSGFKVVLSPEVPRLVAEEVPKEVEALLEEADVGREKPDFLVAHPGGPRVLEALQDALDLDADMLRLSWDSLQQHGNMSSASVLFILKDTLDNPPPADSVGVMTALGPGFCAEFNLLRKAS